MMPFFGRREVIWSSTSYGYTAPVAATARGWTCLSGDCGTTEYEAVKRWPKSCPMCGSATDPRFDMPWAHDAEGIEMRFLAARGEGGGFYADQVLIWDYRDAVVRGDEAAATRARLAGQAHTLRRLAADGAWYGPGTISYPIFLAAMAAERFADAADELRVWTRDVPITDLESNNGRRTNARQVIDACVKFLASPQASTSTIAVEVREKLPHLAYVARDVLTVDNRDGLRSIGIS